MFVLIRSLAIGAGVIAGGSIGWNRFGILGCVAGALIGFLSGAVIGQLPLLVGLKRMSRQFDRMTDEQLSEYLHDRECLATNLVLLELDRRGSDIQRELPFVHSLLASDEVQRRTRGWAALMSAFPELVGRVPGYSPTATTAECRAKCEPLLNATEKSDEREPPVTRDLRS
jgi:hypothetical protein